MGVPNFYFYSPHIEPSEKKRICLVCPQKLDLCQRVEDSNHRACSTLPARAGRASGASTLSSWSWPRPVPKTHKRKAALASNMAAPMMQTLEQTRRKNGRAGRAWVFEGGYFLVLLGCRVTSHQSHLSRLYRFKTFGRHLFCCEWVNTHSRVCQRNYSV